MVGTTNQTATRTWVGSHRKPISALDTPACPSGWDPLLSMSTHVPQRHWLLDP